MFCLCFFLQQKPAFGFGAAQPTVSSAAPSFGGFGATTATTGKYLVGVSSFWQQFHIHHHCSN